MTLGIRRRVGAALDRRFSGAIEVLERQAAVRQRELRSDLSDLHEGLSELQDVIDPGFRGLEIASDKELLGLAHTTRDLADRLGRLEDELARAHRLLRVLVDDEPGNCRRLWELRKTDEYERAYDEAEPLVTVSVTTRDRAKLLSERSLPSILEQTYARLEIIVVGDDATPEVEAAVRRVKDPRVSFRNLKTRVVKDTAQEHWLAGATLLRNEAHSMSTGLWTLDFDDDDSLRPDAVEGLLQKARAERAELAYGLFEAPAPDGTSETLGHFPPRFGDFSLAAAIVHGGLRIFAREHFQGILGIPGDWYKAERMLRVGVRFAHLDRAVMDYYASRLWDPQALERDTRPRNEP